MRRSKIKSGNFRAPSEKLHPRTGTKQNCSSKKPVKKTWILGIGGCREPNGKPVSRCIDRLPEAGLSRLGNQRQRLLDSLSTYDHLAAYKQAARKRHGNTAQWLSRTLEMDRWLNHTGYPLLWCSGKREYSSYVTQICNRHRVAITWCQVHQEPRKEL